MIHQGTQVADCSFTAHWVESQSDLKIKSLMLSSLRYVSRYCMWLELDNEEEEGEEEEPSILVWALLSDLILLMDERRLHLLLAFSSFTLFCGVTDTQNKRSTGTFFPHCFASWAFARFPCPASVVTPFLLHHCHLNRPIRGSAGRADELLLLREEEWREEEKWTSASCSPCRTSMGGGRWNSWGRDLSVSVWSRHQDFTEDHRR